MRFAFAAAFLLSATPALSQPLHQYADLALSPDGARIAAVESDVEANAPSLPHGHIVIRAAATGAILDSLDPCAACTYSGLTFAPDGRLVFLAREGGATRLMLAAARNPEMLATI